MGMSTKRIFDDMYLFLKEVNMNYNKNINNVDEMNGLPAQTYHETTSQFWNLIYKSSHADQLKEKSQGYGAKPENRAQSFNIAGGSIDQEFYATIQQNSAGFGFNMPMNISLDMANPVIR